MKMEDATAQSWGCFQKTSHPPYKKDRRVKALWSGYPRKLQDFSPSLEITWPTALNRTADTRLLCLIQEKEEWGISVVGKFPTKHEIPKSSYFPNFNCLRVVAFHTRKFLNSECPFYRFEPERTQNPLFPGTPPTARYPVPFSKWEYPF